MILHFSRLIRTINLIIIAVTMLGIVDYMIDFPIGFSEHFNLWILIITTLIIAAGGNIINDYFDVKADLQNRPDTVVVGRFIKKRWAILLHLIFNFVGIMGGLYFFFRFHTSNILFIHFFTTGVLWWYSVRLKKIPLIGNITIAALILLVIYMTLIYLPYGFPSFSFESVQNDPHFGSLNINKTSVIIYYAFIGFTLNLAREIIKDTEDIKGDELINAKTLPMIIGVPNTIRIVGAIMLIYPLIYFLGLGLHFQEIALQKLWPLTLAAIVCCMGILPLFFPKNHWIIPIKQALKITMILGILYLFL